jgi:DNA-binding MarR family transcriptional regulator
MPRLDASRIELWRDLSRVVADTRLELDRRLEAETGLSLVGFDALAFMENSGGRVRLADLARHVGLTRPATTRLVDRLDSAGMVTRELIEGDGRGVEAVLTRKGAVTQRRVRLVYRRALQELVGQHLSVTDVLAVQRVLSKWTPRQA